MNSSKYPYLKVFFAFWFTPLAVGVVASPVVFEATLAQLFSNPRALGEVVGLELWMVFFSTPVLAQLVYLVPALGFALFVTLCAFRKGRRAYKIIALSGGTVAFLWITWLASVVLRKSDGFWFADNALPLISAFIIGAVGCGLMAFIVLPAPPGVDETFGQTPQTP